MKSNKIILALVFFLFFSFPLRALPSTNDIDSLIATGRQYFIQANFPKASEQFFKALQIAEKQNNKLRVGIAYTNIAFAYNETKKFDAGKQYAQKAIDIFTPLQNNKQLAHAYNALGQNYYEQAIDSLAVLNYTKAVDYGLKAQDSLLLFVVYKNLGAALLYAYNDTAACFKYGKKSLNYLTAKDDTAKWFSAYRTLAEMYVYNGYFDEGKYYLDKASVYLPYIKAYHLTRDYHYALYWYYYNKAKFEKALEEYTKYDALKDSVDNIAKTKQLHELNIKYETKKKEIELAHRQQIIKRQAHEKQMLILGFVLLLIGLVPLFLFFRQKQKHKTQLLLQAQHEKAMREIFNAEQNERIRIARDLHDSIGQKLSVVRMLMPQTKGDKNLEKAASYLDETATEVRHISHNLIPEILNLGLVKAIDALADRINSTEKIKVSFVADSLSHEIKLAKQTEISLYRIAQEILNNIVRHAKTDNIQIELHSEEHFIQLIIKDTGIGFDTQTIDESKGIGWKNIFARVKLINGEIKIQSEQNKGSNFLINIPLA